jgi:hypothetical protein
MVAEEGNTAIAAITAGLGVPASKDVQISGPPRAHCTSSVYITGMSSEALVKRLHVGGITPNITTDHLKARFQSFGKVQTVDELAPDALGASTSYYIPRSCS